MSTRIARCLLLVLLSGATLPCRGVSATPAEAERSVQAGMELLRAPTAEKAARARELFLGALAAAPDLEGAHLGLVYADLVRHYLAQPAGDAGALEEAVTHARAVLQHNPAQEDARYKLGQALFLLGRPDEGLAALKEGLARAPSSSLLREGLVVLLLRAGRWEDAVAVSREALGAAPGDAEFHVRLGRIWLEAGRPAPAREHFQTAERARASRESALGLAAADVAEAKYDAAIARLEALQQSRPADGEVQRDLAIAFEEAGDEIKARLAWTKLRATSGDERLRALAAEHIERRRTRPRQEPNTGGP